MPSFLNKLRSCFLSPNSNLELSFRTIYHQFNSSRLSFYIKDVNSRRSYLRSRRGKEKFARSANHKDIKGPFVSFFIEVTPQAADESINSIRSLLSIQNGQFQLVIVLPDEAFQEYIISQITVDNRVNFQIGRLLNISECTGEYFVFCQPGDVFFPNILDSFYEFYQNCPNLNLYYFDCEYFQEGKNQAFPLCKPSRISMDSLLSVNMFSRAFIRKDFVTSKCTEKVSHDLGLCEYDIALFASQTPESVAHIPEVLLQQKCLMQPDRPEVVEIVKKHLILAGMQDISHDQRLNQPHFSWNTKKLHVAIIVPTKDHAELLGVTYILIGNNGIQGFQCLHY